jgi:pyruvate dehydrogenase (quinone)
VLIDARTDPEVRPLPPHITFEQAKAYAQSLSKEPDRWHLLKKSAKELVEDYVPHRNS